MYNYYIYAKSISIYVTVHQLLLGLGSKWMEYILHESIHNNHYSLY